MSWKLPIVERRLSECRKHPIPITDLAKIGAKSRNDREGEQKFVISRGNGCTSIRTCVCQLTSMMPESPLKTFRMYCGSSCLVRKSSHISRTSGDSDVVLDCIAS